MVSPTVVVLPTKPSSVTTAMSVSMRSCRPRLIVTVRHQEEASRVTISAGHEFENRTLAIIQRRAQPIHFMLDIAQRLIGCFQRTVFDLQGRYYRAPVLRAIASPCACR